MGSTAGSGVQVTEADDRETSIAKTMRKETTRDTLRDIIRENIEEEIVVDGFVSSKYKILASSRELKYSERTKPGYAIWVNLY